MNNIKISLNNNWKMDYNGTEYKCYVPCSVYKTLIENKLIEDPYYRENEYISTKICDDDYTFSKTFEFVENKNPDEKFFLKFDCVDTLSEIYLNGRLLGKTDNMHRIWEYDVTDILVSGENSLSVQLKSPNKFIKEKYENRKLWGVDSTMEGYPYLRKAHCMFGWDWGPKLPDMGIYREVTLKSFAKGRIENVYYSQIHEKNKVTLNCKAEINMWEGSSQAELKVTSPDGKIYRAKLDEGKGSIEIENPQLWWVNGYGEQPLYKCEVILKSGEEIIDSNLQNTGLRTLTISQEKDEWGEEFCFINNGVKIFAMGGNYIPEDQIVSRCSKEKTENLLEQCKKVNFNFIRVWGGGYYPEDYFYDWCDRNGIIIWQDFMFACSAYLLTPEFESTVREEIKDNVIRLRNHPSLGLWCGNNEIESAWEYWGLPEDEQAQDDYLVLFEKIIPEILEKNDPDKNTFYWPSSPSSGGGFRDASSNHAGDMHYWDVWHGLKPIEDFRKFHYRFCSEYGFEALPDIKTCRSFADESKGDFDLCSPVMETHQKCVQGNEKIMFYLAQMVRYPYDFERLIYSSQLVQSDCIRSNVEHMRRARGRCMGSAYWQINDSNPVISWASIDYFGRWKGLHYSARKFYAPCLLSVDDSEITKPVFNISNERLKPFNGRLEWALRRNTGEIILMGSGKYSVEKLTAENVLTIDLSDELTDRFERREKYLEYALYEDGEKISEGSTLFVRPKEFTFLDPEISYEIYENKDEFVIDLSAVNYAKSVCLSLSEDDCIFSDNWFDIQPDNPVTVAISKKDLSHQISLEELKKQLKIMSNYQEVFSEEH